MFFTHKIESPKVYLYIIKAFLITEMVSFSINKLRVAKPENNFVYFVSFFRRMRMCLAFLAMFASKPHAFKTLHT